MPELNKENTVPYIDKTVFRANDQKTTLRLLSALLEYVSDSSEATDKAEALMNTFDTFKESLSASADQYAKLGLNKQEIIFLKLLNATIRTYYSSLLDHHVNRYDRSNIKKYLLTHYSSLPKERIVVMMYDAKSLFIKESILSIGTTNSVNINLRSLFEELLMNGARSIVLAHNHPKGCPEPSMQDISATRKLKSELGKIDIDLLDHYIIGSNQIYSIDNSTYT